MREIDSIQGVASEFDVIVFDQWGVLHNGTAPYGQAVETLARLRTTGQQTAVLSNSGKSAKVNADRITAMGFAPDAFDHVMTSGEALRMDLASGALSVDTLFAITAARGDAERWLGDLPVALSSAVKDADVVLLMGLPDGNTHEAERAALHEARLLNKRLICSNPDRASPRAGGVTVTSPGALAHDYQDSGGEVIFYGKPHPPVFEAVMNAFHDPAPERILMVGDSPEHDIAGAHAVGWRSLFISGGLHADKGGSHHLFDEIAPPDYTLTTLR